MKPSISASGVSVSGSVGGQKGSVGVKDNGTINIGIDVAGVKLGVTSDYGGAGTIGFGGQSITWGAEGGNIKLGVGGFEVSVEARDCVVVETKKIAGMIVAQRSYPDPGCKSPEPSEPPKTPEPPPPNSSDPVIAVEVPNTDVEGWVFIHVRFRGGWAYKDGVKIPLPEAFHRRQITSVVDKTRSRWVNRAPFDITLFPSEAGGFTYLAPKGTYLFIHSVIVKDARFSGFFGDIPTLAWQFASSLYFSGDASPLFLWGNFSVIRNFLRIKNEQNAIEAQKIDEQGIRPLTHEYIPYACIPFIDPPSAVFPPSAGNRPPMPESCCESLKADIEDIKLVLATKEMLAKKLTFPWRLRMPGGEGDEIITDYPNLARCIAQMIDHLGIHPPKLSIKDINNAVAGDQSISNQFPSATQGFEALMAQVWDANADVDTLTNFLYRLSWLCVQQSMNLAVVSSDIQCIKDMVGGTIKLNEASITTPFNIGAGVKEASTRGKGFGKAPGGGIDKKIDANTELSTESLLPDFLKIRKNPIVVESFAGDKDIFDMLSMVLLKIETLLARG
jgi:hypothetical protein